MPGMPGMPPVVPGVAQGMASVAEEGVPVRPFFEWVYANAGEITRHNEPEFTIRVPEYSCPCEVVCSVEQLDARMSQIHPVRKPPAEVLVKVYENVSGDCYSRDLVCKSNWIPCRDSMVAFLACKGGLYKVVAEFPSAATKIERMVFRCYSNRPNVTVTAAAAGAKHSLVVPTEPPKAIKWTFVGSIREERYLRGDVPMDKPEPLDTQHDSMRKPEFDMQYNWKDFAEEARRDCSMM
mmetsp:Transcript_111617/g.315204  ORF Transcript_111617/g.315204 Transcript_111617/m.315204 type:complete len:237 (-) Transcript_111617:78-788(-)